jgi:hypothetical protein
MKENGVSGQMEIHKKHSFLGKRITLKLAERLMAGMILAATVGGLSACSSQGDIETHMFVDGTEIPLTPAIIQPTETASNAQTVKTPETQISITLGEEASASLTKFGINWTPDLHVSFITDFQDNTRRFFIGANERGKDYQGRTYLLEGKADQSIEDVIKNAPTGKLPIVWGPEKFPNPNEYTYSCIGSVVPVEQNNPNHLIGFTHNEEHAGNGYFTASISQIESFDGGETWKLSYPEPIIKGDAPVPPGKIYSGAGQPDAIVKDNNVLLYYTDWASGLHQDQIFLAKAPIVNNKLDKFKFYKGNNLFDYGETNLTPVIPVPENSTYSALASVSYNEVFNQLLCGLEGSSGFFVCTSSDGINFSKPSLLYRFSQGFEHYPTILSDGKGVFSDGTTDVNAKLVYAYSPNEMLSPHDMVIRPLTIK